MELRPISQELENLEKIIEDGLQSFVAVGNALLQVREGMLYKERGFKRFEDYCQERWGMQRTQADRLIRSTEVAELIKPIGLSEVNEGQARELSPILTKIGPAKVLEVWEQVQRVAARDEEPITAKLIRREVHRLLPPKEKKKSKAIAEFDADFSHIHPDYKDPDRWGRGVTANNIASNFVRGIVRSTIDEDLDGEAGFVVEPEFLLRSAREGDINDWLTSLIEHQKAITQLIESIKEYRNVTS